MTAESSWTRSWASQYGEMGEWAHELPGVMGVRGMMLSVLLAVWGKVSTHRHIDIHTHTKCKVYSE